MSKKLLTLIWTLSLALTATTTWHFARKDFKQTISPAPLPQENAESVMNEKVYKENEDPIPVPESLTTVEAKDLNEGSGKEVSVGSDVQIHYIGRLHSGKIIDSSKRRFKPYTFKIGHGQALQGLEIGVLGMKEGGIRRLIIPPQFGYGLKGASNGLVPGNATLIYDVEVLKVSE